MIQFSKAVRKALRLRLAIDGPAGSGKTFTSLRFATALGKRIAVISSESGAVEKYLGLAPDGVPFDFDICYLPDFSPTSYTQAILAAGQARYDVLLIDSLSHAWAGDGGALEIVSRQGGNSYTAWKDVTPMHNKMIEAILRSPCHVVATMRSKTDYVLETQTNKSGQTVQVPKKVGMAPVQRAGMEYEFDVYCSLDADTHVMRVTKTRCPAIDGAVVVKPGADFMAPVVTWLSDGVEVSPDHYAVTEADLKAQAAAAEADKTEEEKAAERKAKATEKAAAMAGAAKQAATTTAPAKPTTATANPTPTATSPDVELVTEKMKAEIRAVITHGSIPQETFAPLLAKVSGGKSKLSELTKTEAAMFHAELLLVTKPTDGSSPASARDAERGIATDSTSAPPASPEAQPVPTGQATTTTGHTGDQLMDRKAPVTEGTNPTTDKPGWSTAPGSITEPQRLRITHFVNAAGWAQLGPGGLAERLAKADKAANVRGLSQHHAAVIIGEREALLTPEQLAAYREKFGA